LAWLPELEIGWFNVVAHPYDAAYWERYRAYDATPCGAQLTAMRRALVQRHWPGTAVDIGIGGGRFVEEFSAFGYDINPLAVDWLKARGSWLDPYRRPVDCATFWDSLEHIADPRPLLANVTRWAFVSIPIFADCDDIIRSRHYRKDEHFWYFTRAGFVEFLRMQGFALAESNCMEQSAGRAQIESFAFRRT
jgi:hypothetical protein